MNVPTKWSHIPVIAALQRLRKEDYEFEANINYVLNLRLALGMQ